MKVALITVALLLFDSLSAVWQFKRLHGVIVSPSTKEVLLLTEPCEAGNRAIDDCTFDLHLLHPLVQLFQHPPCQHAAGVSFSLDPFDPLNPWAGYLRKVFHPAACSSLLRDSLAGEVMFNADWNLKQLVNDTISMADSIEGYKSVFDLFDSDVPKDMMTRLWISVAAVEVSHSIGSMTVYGKAHLEVKAVNVISNASSPSGLSEYGMLHPAYQLFINQLNNNMDRLTARFRSFRQLQQLGIAQEAVKFILARQGRFPEGYLHLLDHIMPSAAMIAPAVISEQKRSHSFSFYAASTVLAGDLSSLHALSAEHLHPSNASHQGISIHPSAWKAADIYHCVPTQGSLAFMTTLTMAGRFNLSLSCMASSNDQDRHIQAPPVIADELRDPCLPGALMVYDEEAQGFLAWPSSYLAIPGQRNYYNVSAKLTEVRWSCELDSIHFTPSSDHLANSTVLLSMSATSSVLVSRICRLHHVLAALQESRVVGIVLVHNDDGLAPAMPYAWKGAGAKEVQVPVRVISRSLGRKLQMRLQREDAAVIVALACNKPITPNEEEEEEEGSAAATTNITFGNSTYRTLDQTPLSARTLSCQADFTEIPVGYEFVPALDAILEHVVAAYPWGSETLVLLNNQACATMVHRHAMPGSCNGKIGVQLKANATSWIRPYTCAKILIRTVATWLPHAGYFYRTLDSIIVDSIEIGGQGDYLALDEDWELAPATSDVLRHVVAEHCWGTSLLLLENGRGYFTKSHDRKGSLIGEQHLLRRDAGGHYAAYDNARILVRQPIDMIDKMQMDEEEYNVVVKHRIQEEISLLLSPMGQMTVWNSTSTNSNSSTKSVFHVILTSSSRIMLHGGVDLSAIRLLHSDADLDAVANMERELLHAASWLGLAAVRDAHSGKIYRVHRVASDVFADQQL